MRTLLFVVLGGLLFSGCAKPCPYGPAPAAPGALAAREATPSGAASANASPPPAPSLPPPADGASVAQVTPNAAPAAPGAPGPAGIRRPPTPAGRAYYVTPSGSGTGCSRAAPCREISDALAQAQGGDVVFVADGIYQPFVVRGMRGTATAPVLIYAQGTGANVSAGTRDSIFIENSFHVILDGINAAGGKRAGVGVLCSNHVTIRNGRYTSNRKWGIFAGFADDLTIDHNETGGSKAQHGIYASNSADRPIIRGNLVHDNTNGGIQINADGSEKPDGDCAWLVAGGIVDGVCTGALIENNIVSGNGTSGGAAINLDGVQSSIVRNNLLFENHASGITNFMEDGSAGPKGMEILGNTVVQAAGARNALQFLATAGPNRVRDNILYHPDARKAGLEFGSAGDVANVDSDDNVFDRVNIDDTVISIHDFQSTYNKDAHSISGTTPSQLFADVAKRVYSLAPGSPAIGKGVFEPHAPTDLLGKPRPTTSTDIGALQH